jgi:hypothetical protein
LSALLPVWLPGVPPGAPAALAERAGAVLVGTDRGLFAEAEGGWSPVPTRGSVRDLANSAEAVWVATERALYEWRAGDAAPRVVSLGAGASVSSIALGPGGEAWAATEVGLFRRGAGASAFVRETSIPAGRVLAVRVAGGEVWAAARRHLWRRSGPEGFQPLVSSLGEGRWELCDAIDLGAATLLCVPEGLWLVEGDGARWIGLSLAGLRGLARTGTTVWAASERGLLGLPVPDLRASKPFAPEPARALPRAVGDVAVGSRGLVVATAGGVARLALERPLPSQAGLRRHRPAHAEAEELRRAVLVYLSLSPHALARAERRAAQAGLLPSVRATFGLDRERGHSDDRDEVFSSGAIRDLADSASDRETSASVGLQLTWALDRLRDPTDVIAISRERRERIELRDEVLDRVNRLYFERLRVLARLASLPDGPGDERLELEIRERELRAGLDGWSGGAFSRLVGALSSPASPGRTP